MNTQHNPSYIVLWDLPKHTPKAKFYRRLRELLDQQGGSARCRATRSAYVVEGTGARSLAYALGALAAAFGAGRIGEQDGVLVFPLGEIAPHDHFAAIECATATVQNLVVDRQTTTGKISPRHIETGVAMPQADPKIIHLEKVFSGQCEVAR